MSSINLRIHATRNACSTEAAGSRGLAFGYSVSSTELFSTELTPVVSRQTGETAMSIYHDILPMFSKLQGCFF